ncbi:MAG: putative toxin-antitoxin system toxin component, PIN family [Rhodocyclaceae bacterium]|nr:MAG: putative toxin-antitoxin system toxin component, PIN family [Rhodocyclaceae bacterium]
MRKGARVRLVLDTNVVLSGLIWRSHPRRLLDLAKEEAVSLYTSSALLDELADVLSREKWTAMLATRRTDAAYLMQRYGVLAKVVRPKRIGRVVPNDPDDDAVIACALAARADLIVSGDKHLLGLGGQYQGIRIVAPTEAVELIGR